MASSRVNTIVTLFILTGCGGAENFGNGGLKKLPPSPAPSAGTPGEEDAVAGQAVSRGPSPQTERTPAPVLGPDTVPTDPLEKKPEKPSIEELVREVRCERKFTVSGRANPWFAGGSPGQILDYGKNPVDSYENSAPILFDGPCLREGVVLGFRTTSNVQNRPDGPKTPSGDGLLDYIVAHQLNSQRGLSTLTAPMASLVGVFLSNASPEGSIPPEPLTFATEQERDYSILKPRLHQLFLIGDGLKSDNTRQKFVVPEGASRLYIGTMDSFEWENNLGSHEVDLVNFEN